MKILFLDIDGVVNSRETLARSYGGFIGIDPYLAFYVGKIILDTGCKVVLSSSWRLSERDVKEVEERVYKIHSKTPPPWEGSTRGMEIQAWLDKHPEVEKYAILDDDPDMLDSQLPNFFKTSFSTGLTEETMYKVINHLND